MVAPALCVSDETKCGLPLWEVACSWWGRETSPVERGVPHILSGVSPSPSPTCSWHSSCFTPLLPRHAFFASHQLLNPSFFKSSQEFPLFQNIKFRLFRITRISSSSIVVVAMYLCSYLFDHIPLSVHPSVHPSTEHLQACPSHEDPGSQASVPAHQS